MYEAESGLREFYKKLDPTNTFNPGIGKMEVRGIVVVVGECKKRILDTLVRLCGAG